LVNGSESWVLKNKEGSHLQATKMKLLREIKRFVLLDPIQSGNIMVRHTASRMSVSVYQTARRHVSFIVRNSNLWTTLYTKICVSYYSSCNWNCTVYSATSWCHYTHMHTCTQHTHIS